MLLRQVSGQLTISVLCSVILGFLIADFSVRYAVGLLLVAAAAVFIYRYFSLSVRFVTVSIVQLLLLTSFIGSAFLTVPFGPATIFPFRAVLLAAIAMFVIQQFRRDSETLAWKDIQVKPMLGFFIFWPVYGGFSLLWVQTVSAGVKDVVFLSAGVFLIFAVVFYFSRLQDFLTGFYIWLGVTAFLAAIGLWEHVTRHHLSVSRIPHQPDYTHAIPTSVFHNENDFATFLVISLFFLLAFVRHIKDWHMKMYGIGLMLVSLYLIYLTNSRASELAFALGLVLWILFLTGKKQRKWLLSILIPIVALVVVELWSKIMEVLGKIFFDFHYLAGPVAPGASLDIRIHLLKNAALFVVNSFGFGVGAGNEEYYMGHAAVFPTYTILDVHNWWMEILTNYGILVFAGYVSVYIALLVALIRQYKQTQNRKEKMIYEALLGGLFVFPLAVLSPSSMMALKYQWVLFALAIGYLNYGRIQRQNKIQNKHNSRGS